MDDYQDTTPCFRKSLRAYGGDSCGSWNSTIRDFKDYNRRHPLSDWLFVCLITVLVLLGCIQICQRIISQFQFSPHPSCFVDTEESDTPRILNTFSLVPLPQPPFNVAPATQLNFRSVYISKSPTRHSCRRGICSQTHR